jgi:aminoglycoside phosphotransferase family enzyme/predicted kinase
VTSFEQVRAALAEEAEVAVRETHISVVFLTAERAYKLKKPVVFPFLDYGTAERRRAMCHEEVRLNRRLAPDIYLGVRSVVHGGPHGFELAPDGAPNAVEHVVEMRRYDERDTLAARLADADLAPVAALLADFHARAGVVSAPALTVERRIADNFHELLAIVEEPALRERLLELARFAHAFAATRADMLDARSWDGHVRDGHGDLRADHVLLDGPAIIDCIEFDPALRAVDVADDLAFLVMDLTARGGERQADELLRAYRVAGGEPGEDALVAFYACYRALVRAKVALLSGDEEKALSRIALAERFAWRARRPLVLVVCGLPAAGKSHLAAALAERSGMPHLSSDVTRKRLAGVAPQEAAPAGAYGAEFSERTYAELGREAAREGAAVVDATFRHRADRDAFREGFGAAARLRFVECVVPRAELERRAALRDREGGAVSDATAAVVAREAGSWEPLDEVPAADHIVLRADRPLPALLADLTALLD